MGTHENAIGANTEKTPLSEILDICTVNTPFFGQYFFPRAVRQGSPDFHYEICTAIENPENEKVAVKVFRGGAKTTLARVILGKRIAFGISRTILVVSETAEHSYETVKWLKHAVERQDLFARTFGLERGDKHTDPNNGETYSWRDDKIQIYHRTLGYVITVVGTGIFGQSRGLNIEDFRPDFILLDDVVDEDNAKTGDQRRKVNERIYGAIANTLAPRSEAPTATMLFLQTPLHREDAIEQARLDPEWTYLEFSCFDVRGQSRWPERWSTEELQRKKQGFVNRNQLSLWLREMEVKVTDAELSYFKNQWVMDNLFEVHPEQMTVYVSVDPTPPPKETEQLTSEAYKDLDDAVVMAVGIWRGDVYVLETYGCKSPAPDELINKIFEFVIKWRPIKVGVETVLFARTVKWHLEKEQAKRRHYFRVEPIEDRRKKSLRIRQELTGLSSAGKIHCRREQHDLIDQFCSYPDVGHDDYLDALAIGVMMMTPEDDDYLEGTYEDITDLEALGDWRGCPSLGAG